MTFSRISGTLSLNVKKIIHMDPGRTKPRYLKGMARQYRQAIAFMYQEENMKYTSAQANKLLKKLMNEQAQLERAETLTSTFVVANTEDVESLRPAYDFRKTQEKVMETLAKIRKVKHAINVFNSETVLPGYAMTIDQVLVYMPQLRARQAKLASMSSRLPKQRCGHYGSSTIIDYDYANFDIEEVRVEAEKLAEEIRNIQTALDLLNNTVEFEIEL